MPRPYSAPPALQGAYFIGYGTLVLLTLVDVFPGPLSFRFSVDHFLWALGVGLIPFGVC